MGISASPRLFIGALAEQSGLSRDALRFYERRGVLHPAGRTKSGYRWYGTDALHRVRVIQRALAIGFSLAELASVFRDRAAGRAPCKRVRALAGQKLAALSMQIAELSRLKADLERTLSVWDRRLADGAAQPARLLDGLAALPLRNEPRARRSLGRAHALRTS